MNRLVHFLKDLVQENFSATIATLASVAICLHFSQIKTMKVDGVPVSIILGQPGAAKSTFVEVAFSTIGVSSKVEGKIRLQNLSSKVYVDTPKI